jgi:hypothetical protein
MVGMVDCGNGISAHSGGGCSADGAAAVYGLFPRAVDCRPTV